MWINPRFEYQVIKFVYDQLIKFRHLAGDNYRPFCGALLSIAPNCNLAEVAKWLNLVVFNSHEKNIRNAATQEQLDDLQNIEKKYTDLIMERYITDSPTLKSKLLDEWKKRIN